MATFKVGDWVECRPACFNDRGAAKRYYKYESANAFPIGQFECHPTLDGWAIVLLEEHDGSKVLYYVHIDGILPAQDPTRKSLADKERAALEAEGWRRRRDENLRGAFREPTRSQTKPPGKPYIHVYFDYDRQVFVGVDAS